MSRDRTGWIQPEGVAWGERAESRRERRASGEKRGIFFKSNLWTRERLKKMRKGKTVIGC